MILELYTPALATFGLSGTAFAALVSGAVGVGSAVYGADKQRRATHQAADANAALQDKQNNSAWASYLLSRGVNPAGAEAGTLPTNPQAVNTRLPIWATARRTMSGGLVPSAISSTQPSSMGSRTWEGLGIRP